MLFTRLFPRELFGVEVGAFIAEKTNALYDAIRAVAVEEATHATGIMDVGVFRLNGRSGDVTLTSDDVGLDLVPNIPPQDLPVSTLQQAAIDLCFDVNDLIPQANVTDLVADLAQRPKTVNGNPPDATGNIFIAAIDMSTLIPRPAVEIPDSFLWYDGTGYYLTPVPDYVVSPDLAGLPDGATLRWDATGGEWVVDDVVPNELLLRDPTDQVWKVTVSDTGVLAATAVPPPP